MAEPVGAESPAGEALSYPRDELFAELGEPETAVDDEGVNWAADGGDSSPAASAEARKSGNIQLVQAAEPTGAGAGGASGASPTAPTTAPATSNAAATGAGGDTAVGGTQSSQDAAADAAGAADAATLRAQHDAATVLRDMPGVNVDAHSPNMHETSLRGRRLGQVPAKGSYWFPARQDLDTLMSKMDSQLVDRIVTFNGPYSALYGPGLAFYDVELLRAPRYDAGAGFETHSQTVGQYETNGEQWLGRQAFWGGDEVWGFRGGYSQRGGSDFETGNGTELPSSYKSRQADLALGGWITPDSRIDFQYLRLDQTDVEFPGQYFDINALVTDSFDVVYEMVDQDMFDSFVLDGWYNRTNFYGDNLRPGKRRILPLDNVQEVTDPISGEITRFTTRTTGFTDVMNHSAGFRAAFGWGDRDGEMLTAGADLRVLGQRIDEFNFLDFTIEVFDAQGVPLAPPFMDQIFSSNPLPRAHAANPGVFCEYQYPVSDRLKVRSGARADWVNMDAAEFVDFVPENISEALGGDFDQTFNLGSGFLTLDFQATDVYAFNAGCGFGMRPPTMTEMYAFGPFVAVLPQYILTSVFGDPNLDPEQMLQLDVGVSADQGDIRSGAHIFHAWVEDYITLDFLNQDGSAAYAFVNTPLATLAGVEAYGEADLVPMLTAFGTVSFVEGRDHSRLSTISRQRQLIAPTSENDQRSQALTLDPMSGFFVPTGPESTVDNEPLPVIAPLASRLGLRLHGPERNSRWNIEFVANVVDNQDRVATSLRELLTPGYTTYDIYANQRLTDSFSVTAGVRNLTDKFYQTYFDTRQVGPTPITTVAQPGINFFFGCEYTR